MDHSSMKPLGCAILKKALGRNTRARMPERTQPVTCCHLGIVSVIILIAPFWSISEIAAGRPAALCTVLRHDQALACFAFWATAATTSILNASALT